jgi:NAD(P)-dependent dehydrogenase (short-subunit alcohol dehydrogenase family)
MAAVDLRGRRILVTGASNGIGKVAALELARLGADLLLVCRDRARGERTVAEIAQATGNRRVELLICDLSSQEEIRKLAREILASERPLHVLLNNAGVILTRRSETVDGLERTFATNHIAYHMLTNLLLERIVQSAPARIVNVASDAHRFAGGALNFDDLQSQRRYSGMRVYGQSKLANILFTRERARRLSGTGVTVNAVHPGPVATGFALNNGPLARLAMRLFSPFARTPEKGAETSIYLCSSPDVEGITGKYWYDCREHQANPHAENDEDARRLWEVSARLCGVGG